MQAQACCLQCSASLEPAPPAHLPVQMCLDPLITLQQYLGSPSYIHLCLDGAPRASHYKARAVAETQGPRTYILLGNSRSGQGISTRLPLTRPQLL